MYLHQYEINLSTLSEDEKDSLMLKIEHWAFTYPRWNPYSQTVTFYLEESIDINSLNVPATCQLTKLV